MASQWHSLVSQKIFLARTLLGQLEQSDSVPAREALLQGATELALRARKSTLVMIARLYQDKQGRPADLDALGELVGDNSPEMAELEQLTHDRSSWWNHLEQLEQHQGNPPSSKKTVSNENIIAIAADTGPDRSRTALEQTLGAMKHFIDILEDRHSEW